MQVSARPWRFDELRARSGLLNRRSDRPAHRARLLVSKIARFEDIKERYDRVHAVREEANGTSRQIARLTPLPPGVSPQADDGRYDGVGRLERVTSPRTGAPQYALLDQFGRVQCYVTPGPGVNLRYYVGRPGGRQRRPRLHARAAGQSPHGAAHQLIDGSMLR